MQGVQSRTTALGVDLPTHMALSLVVDGRASGKIGRLFYVSAEDAEHSRKSCQLQEKRRRALPFAFPLVGRVVLTTVAEEPHLSRTVHVRVAS